MRQGQQNRRGRGRNHNNNQHRKGGQNPLSRSYESAGPDTKIRGTPAHIAEKYMQLARDAQSSGDPVLAENYLQHAEHYNRIILTYREQQLQNGEANQHNGQQPRMRSGEDNNNGSDDENSGDGSQQPRQHDRQDRHERQGRDRSERNNDRGDRGDRDQRRSERAERRDNGEDRGRAQASDRDDDSDDAPLPPRRRERAAAMAEHEQPEFLRRSVRRPRRATQSEAQPDDAGEQPAEAAAAAGDSE